MGQTELPCKTSSQTNICSYTLRQCSIDRLFFFTLGVFWNVMLRRIVNIYRRFGGAQCPSSRIPRTIVILTLEKRVNWVTIRGTTCTKYILIGYLGPTLIHKNYMHEYIKNTQNSGIVLYYSVRNFLSSRLLSKKILR